jgi:hypothetical protein
MFRHDSAGAPPRLADARRPRQSTSRISGLPGLRVAARVKPAFSKTRLDPT